MKRKYVDLEEVRTQDFIDMVLPSTLKFFTDYYISGNTYRSVWAVRQYPSTTSEQALLRHLGEKDGVTLRIYTRQVTLAEERKIELKSLKFLRLCLLSFLRLQQGCFGL